MKSPRRDRIERAMESGRHDRPTRWVGGDSAFHDSGAWLRELIVKAYAFRNVGLRCMSDQELLSHAQECINRSLEDLKQFFDRIRRLEERRAEFGKGLPGWVIPTTHPETAAFRMRWFRWRRSHESSRVRRSGRSIPHDLAEGRRRTVKRQVGADRMP